MEKLRIKDPEKRNTLKKLLAILIGLPTVSFVENLRSLGVNTNKLFESKEDIKWLSTINYINHVHIPGFFTKNRLKYPEESKEVHEEEGNYKEYFEKLEKVYTDVLIGIQYLIDSEKSTRKVNAESDYKKQKNFNELCIKYLEKLETENQDIVFIMSSIIRHFEYDSFLNINEEILNKRKNIGFKGFLDENINPIKDKINLLINLYFEKFNKDITNELLDIKNGSLLDRINNSTDLSEELKTDLITNSFREKFLSYVNEYFVVHIFWSCKEDNDFQQIVSCNLFDFNENQTKSNITEIMEEIYKKSLLFIKQENKNNQEPIIMHIKQQDISLFLKTINYYEKLLEEDINYYEKLENLRSENINKHIKNNSFGGEITQEEQQEFIAKSYAYEVFQYNVMVAKSLIKKINGSLGEEFTGLKTKKDEDEAIKEYLRRAVKNFREMFIEDEEHKKLNKALEKARQFFIDYYESNAFYKQVENRKYSTNSEISREYATILKEINLNKINSAFYSVLPIENDTQRANTTTSKTISKREIRTHVFFEPFNHLASQNIIPVFIHEMDHILFSRTDFFVSTKEDYKKDRQKEYLKELFQALEEIVLMDKIYYNNIIEKRAYAFQFLAELVALSGLSIDEILIKKDYKQDNKIIGFISEVIKKHNQAMVFSLGGTFPLVYRFGRIEKKKAQHILNVLRKIFA